MRLLEVETSVFVSAFFLVDRCPVLLLANLIWNCIPVDLGVETSGLSNVQIHLPGPSPFPFVVLCNTAFNFQYQRLATLCCCLRKVTESQRSFTKNIDEKLTQFH